MAKSDRHHGVYCRSAFHLDGESEGSGSTGQIDTEITTSENSSDPMRKCIDLNTGARDNFGVPIQVLSASLMSLSEIRSLIHKLRSELEQVRVLQKKVEFQTVRAGAVSCGSNIVSHNNVVDGSRLTSLKKSSAMPSMPGKKLNPSGKGRGNKGYSGESTNLASVTSITNAMLMKQCEGLLKRLMSHQHAWVFNSPVDVVKLNIPDYLIIIKHPMDLGTIKKKIALGAYSGPLEFLADVRLTFQNAMTYNPKGNDVHFMADVLSKYFEVRWKTIEKKISKADVQPLHEELGSHEEMETTDMSPAKRRKTASFQHEPSAEPVKQVMSNEEKHNLARKLESLMGDIPLHIIDFLREDSLNGKDAEEDEIEIDFDDFSDDTLFALRKLLDDYIQEKHKNQEKVEHCEMELLNDSGPSNSSMPLHKGNEPGDDEVDIGGDEPPVTSYPSLGSNEKDPSYILEKCVGSELGKDGNFGIELEAGHGSSTVNSKVSDTLGLGSQLVNKTSTGDLLENQQSCGLDQHEQVSWPNLSSMESGGHQDGDSARCQKRVSPDQQYRAAFLKNRFADIILKSQEKTLLQNKGHVDDPEKLQREREELELRKRKEKARLQAEAEAAEDARRQAVAVVAEEARKKRELEREAARQALLKMEKTVEIDENSLLLEELKMFSSAPVEHLPSFVDDASPDKIQDGLGGINLGGSNPLEKLGLFMKKDEEEEECDPMNVLKLETDLEEGEID